MLRTCAAARASVFMTSSAIGDGVCRLHRAVRYTWCRTDASARRALTRPAAIVNGLRRS